MRLGFFGARSDRTGLGNQWVAMSKMLRPDHIALVNSTPFNGNRQCPERYDGFSVTEIMGFPTHADVAQFLQGVDVVFTIETPYNHRLFELARIQRKRVILMVNFEFFDLLQNRYLPQPTYVLAPSQWHLEEMKRLFPNRVRYLPPPTFVQDFRDAREVNLSRSGRRRFLHVVGLQAVHDRNGTLSLIDALQNTTADFELVIKAQRPLDIHIDDHRVTMDYTSPDDEGELYKDFDVLLYPRRYGGLALPMNEGLMSGLPVIMTDVSPNNAVLPPEWLVPASKTGEFMARTMIDIYSADPIALASKIDELCAMDDDKFTTMKTDAFELGYSNYSADVLRPQYQQVLGL